MNANGAPPWIEFEAYIPGEFTLTYDGLFFRRKTEEEYIASPCWISGETRSVEDDESGVVIKWIDPHDSHVRQLAVQKRRFHEQGGQLIQVLVDRGLHLVPGNERLLLRYLGSIRLPADHLKVSTARSGWMQLQDGSPLFVTPERVISQAGIDDRVVLQGNENQNSAFTSKGALEQWQRNVYTRCKDHPLLSFAIYTSLAAPLMKWVDLDSGGFHFYGASSKGKTTLLQAAASVWGNGADPAVSHDTLMNRWNSTANAFEATASAYNDLLLPLDELGTCDVKDAGKVTYDLFGGRGKARLTRDSLLQKNRSWRLLGLSSGEISLREKVREISGKPAHTGQLIRLADIPIPLDGVLDPLAEEPGTEINQIKQACGRFYGTVGPAFVQELLQRFAEQLTQEESLSSGQLATALSAELRQVEQRLRDGLTVESHHLRVIRRFALVALAGILAVRFGLLPRTPEANIIFSVCEVRDAWFQDDQNLPESARGLNALRTFILLNEDRFRPADDENRIVRDRAGYRTVEPGTSRVLYLFEGTSFDEMCRDARCSPKVVLQALKQQNLLFMNDKRSKSRHSIAGMNQRPWFYAVRAKIVER